MSTTASTATQTGARTGLAERSRAFLDYLDRFLDSLPERSLADVIAQAGGPERVAVVAVDVVNGFCTTGPLASDRVGAIVPPSESLLRAAHAAGVRAMAVLRDSHDPQAPEFAQFAPHCIAGTAESALVEPLAGLPFAGSFFDVPKNATSAWAGATRFASWVAEQEQAGVNTFVVVGDCTDLCVYQTSMPLKLSANARNRALQVIVPANCVDTYDLEVETARGLGALPHDGALLHAVFLYHLQLNGVQVVARLVA
ncbi:MAG: cysteine hydrolase family protein [Chloroflexota bacterium]